MLFVFMEEAVACRRWPIPRRSGEQIRQDLVAVGLELMTKQGIQRTTVEQIYQKVGISRSFFYTFFPTKEDLVVEMLYLQQPRVVEYARRLLADPALGLAAGSHPVPSRLLLR